MIGKTLAHYHIIGEIGKGGMGEVYQATDRKLGRDVAIKVLPEEFAWNAERVARFQREAKLLASLNHPNIAAIYGLEEYNGIHFIVMELVEGQTLDERIKSGPLSVEESLKLGFQIAEALEAAHEKGVIHRDLKPANIKVTPDGKVKVLDFGLAKAFTSEKSDQNLSNSPTLSVTTTQQGVILGTAAYMSPEQARGKPVDKRSDIWAFGVILFEMLTGCQIFLEDTLSDTMASVLKTEPEWRSLPENLHPRFRLMLERCLKKEVSSRYHDISDARVDIQEVLADPGGINIQSITADKSHKNIKVMLPFVVVLVVIIIVGMTVRYLNISEKHQVVRFEHDLTAGQQFSDGTGHHLAVSADGTQFMYCTKDGLYLRSVDKLESQLLVGADEYPQSPFFSPDGQWIGYWARNDSELKKIAISDGVSSTLCDATGVVGAIWYTGDTIIYSNRYGIMRASAEGGTPETLIEGSAGFPQLISNGKSIMFTDYSSQPYKIAVQSLKGGERKRLFAGSNARYLPTGHLVYRFGNELLAVPFDPEKLEKTGGAISLVKNIDQFALSDSGTLVYVTSSVSDQSILEWYDRQGNHLGSIGEPGSYGQFSLSPDDKRIVIERKQSFDISDLWVLELDRGGMGFPITSGISSADNPIWSPDGNYIAFSSDGNIYRKSLLEEEPELLLESKDTLIAEDWSGNGRFVDYLKISDTGRGIWRLPLFDDQTPIKVIEGPINYDEPKVSPDGKWLAYVSKESGQNEVYIRSLEENGEKQIVSKQGGGQPKWRGDGRELFYLTLDGSMMVMETGGEQIKPDAVKSLFQTSLIVNPGRDQYAVTRDGQRFLILTSGKADGDSSVNVVLNWFEELKEQVSVP